MSKAWLATTEADPGLGGEGEMHGQLAPHYTIGDGVLLLAMQPPTMP